MKESLKALGSGLLGIAFIVGAIVLLALLFSFGTRILFEIEPFINTVAGLLFALNIVAIFVAVFRRARPGVGIFLFFSSYVFGLSLWIYGFAATLSLWGVLAVIIGLFIAGIGIVPLGIMAALFNAEWSVFWGLVIMALLTLGTRIIGMVLAESDLESKHQGQRLEVAAEVDDVSTSSPTRSWDDIG